MSRRLLDKIIDFSVIGGGASGAGSAVITPSYAKAMKRSLQVIKMLAETTGSTGKLLRREVAEIVFTVSNIVRAVLQHEAGHLELQRLGAEVRRGRVGCSLPPPPRLRFRSTPHRSHAASAGLILPSALSAAERSSAAASSSKCRFDGGYVTR
uniref:Uncharacterized protein n=1 Tax=Oryza glumipatula TaxID=40148 RepID=A0A0E0BTC3_9ORYZ